MGSQNGKSHMSWWSRSGGGAATAPVDDAPVAPGGLPAAPAPVAVASALPAKRWGEAPPTSPVATPVAPPTPLTTIEQAIEGCGLRYLDDLRALSDAMARLFVEQQAARDAHLAALAEQAAATERERDALAQRAAVAERERDALAAHLQDVQRGYEQYARDVWSWGVQLQQYFADLLAAKDAQLAAASRDPHADRWCA
jgi:hypothetical protein